VSVLAGSRGKHFADAEIVHKDQRFLALLITPEEKKRKEKKRKEKKRKEKKRKEKKRKEMKRKEKKRKEKKNSVGPGNKMD